jgi:PhnB protein
MRHMYRPTNRIYPRLAYDDEHAAIDHLTRVLGFVETEVKENDDGSVLAWLELDGSAVMVCGVGFGLSSPRELGGVSHKVNCYVDDVDAHYERAVAGGAVIDREIETMPWGDRRYETIDPEGHRWHFAQVLPEGE